jgi:hypothetical protein
MKSNPMDPVHLPWVLYTEHQAAAMLKVSVQFLRHRRRLRLPPTYAKLGKSVRYRLSDLESFAATAVTRGAAK